jgi:hypothetical protein
VSNWKPLSGRIGLVASGPVAPGTLSVLKLYSEAFGAEPQNFQTAQNPLMVSTAQGSKSGMVVNCILATNRVDFNLSPSNPSGSVSAPRLQLIDDEGGFYDQLLLIAEAIGSGKISIPQAFDRATVFVQFAAIESDWATANAALTRVMPERYRPKLENEEAFSLQINHPRSIQTGDGAVQLNFLTKWSVEQFQVITFEMATGGFAGGVGQPNMMQPSIKTYLGACLTFDCNVAMPPMLPNTQFLSADQRQATLMAGLGLIGRFQHQFGLDLKGFPDDKQIH